MADEINNLKAGQPISPEQKAALAKSNEEATVEAQRLAAEHRRRDAEEGKGEPVVKTVADSLKDKLHRQDFQKKDA